VKAKRNRFTLDQARIELQASEEELAEALKEKHILIIDGNISNGSPCKSRNDKADGQI
jgi:hypothetical protein